MLAKDHSAVIFVLFLSRVRSSLRFLWLYSVEPAQTPIVKGCNTTKLLKAAGKITDVGKPQGLTDGGNAVAGLLQLFLCRANQPVVYVLANGYTDFLSESFLQVAL